jgi:hypothetical protein
VQRRLKPTPAMASALKRTEAPNPFQRISCARRRIDSAGYAMLAGMAARLEALTGRPTTSAECPTRFNGFPVPVADTELTQRTPWPMSALRPDQPRSRGEELRRAVGDGGAVGDVDGTTHEQHRTPNPFQRIARPSRRRRIDSAGDINCMGLTKLMSMAPIRQ